MKVGFADHLAEGHWVLIAKSVVDCPCLREFDFGAVAEHGRQARLRVHVDSKHTVTAQRIPLREMDGRGGFAGAALEIDN